jgi:serine/threonine-protein kinase
VGLTQTGQILGTPRYMAPEQSRSTSQVDARADLYSVGCILYEMLTGGVPFAAKSPYECVVMHTVEPVPAPSERRPGLPSEVEAVVLRCLKKLPRERFGSSEELLQAWQEAWDVATTARLRSSGVESAMAQTTGAGSAPSAAGDGVENPAQSRSSELPRDPILAGALRWLAPVLATLALLAGGGLFLNSHEDEAARSSLAPDTAGPGEGAPAATAPVPAPEPPRTRTESAVAPDAVPAPAGESPRLKRLRSRPNGARVFVGRELLGRTPLELSVPAGGELEVTLRRLGYRTERHTLRSDDPEEVEVRLHRTPRSAPTRPGLAPL